MLHNVGSAAVSPHMPPLCCHCMAVGSAHSKLTPVVCWTLWLLLSPAGKAVFQVQYSDSTTKSKMASTICPAMRALGMSSIYRNKDLTLATAYFSC